MNRPDAATPVVWPPPPSAAADAASRAITGQAPLTPTAAAASCPALVIAAAASGQGKTTLTAALARLHTRQGRRVHVFKCGPDYLDPHWHHLASGQPVQQLDLWMTGPQDCAARLYAAAQQADLILIEGVMGLFDGADSVADLAQRFGIPVLAVVDAWAMGGSLGALAFGLRHFRSELPWAGVLANRVAGAGHAQLLRDGLRDSADWLGALPRLNWPPPGEHHHAQTSAALLPERQQGLVAAQELPDALQRLDYAADALAATPLGQMDAAALQRFRVSFAAPASAPSQAAAPLLVGRRIAVAHDAAFSNLYPANLQTLRALGAEAVWFSPLTDSHLPPCDALWLPGGPVAHYAAQLAANQPLRQALHQHVAQGKPVWAEGTALLALCESLEGQAGQPLTMWGLLPAQCRVLPRPQGLGPRQWPHPQGTLRGHSYHPIVCRSTAIVCGHAQRPGSAAGAATDAGAEPIYQWGSVRASLFQPWFASSPTATAALFTGEPAGVERLPRRPQNGKKVSET